MVPPLDRTWMIGKWRVPEYQIPIIIGVSSGVLILLLTVAVLIIWRCCRMQNFDEKKAYGTYFILHNLCKFHQILSFRF